MRVLKSMLWGLVIAGTCLSVGCSGQPKIDPEKDKPVMDNVPPPKP